MAKVNYGVRMKNWRRNEHTCTYDGPHIHIGAGSTHRNYMKNRRLTLAGCNEHEKRNKITSFILLFFMWKARQQRRSMCEKVYVHVWRRRRDTFLEFTHKYIFFCFKDLWVCVFFRSLFRAQNSFNASIGVDVFWHMQAQQHNMQPKPTPKHET